MMKKIIEKEEGRETFNVIQGDDNMKIKQLKKKYKYIVAWRKMMRSHWYYVEDQLLKAEKDKAPEDSLFYKDKDKKWHTVSECYSPESIKAELQGYIDGKKGTMLY